MAFLLGANPFRFLSHRGLRGFASDVRKKSRSLDMTKIVRVKPVTPGQRFRVKIDRSELWSGRPIRALTVGLRKSGGRGHGGKISNRNIGGGCRRLYRFIDFKRNRFDVPATVVRLEYDPNRSGYIALVKYPDNELKYILAPQSLEPGAKILSSKTEIAPEIGNTMPLKHIPLGSYVHNLEMRAGQGGKLIRSAGTGALVVEKSSKEGYVSLRLQSKEEKYFRGECLATIGKVSNPFYNRIRLGKAGRARLLGRRPHVRGVAMNPVDHPHGGGQGKTKGGRPSVSPTGILAHGFKTRRNHISKLVTVTRAEAAGSKKKKR